MSPSSSTSTSRLRVKWHGIDVFKPGAVKDGAHTFAVVRVTDDAFAVARGCASPTMPG